jgi:ParB-like chromosome segregation protein Spo0J
MLAFSNQLITLSLDQILPIKPLTSNVQHTEKFKQILASVKAVGIIEPPAVIANKETPDQYMLLDGHLRLHALKMLDMPTVACLISTDDECYTYNKHINRLSTIQEHNMILRAVERGVPEQKIAEALNVNVSNIRAKKNMLRGICPEVVDMLKDKQIAAGVFNVLRKMKPLRQVDAVTLMQTVGNFSVSYVNTIYGATAEEDLAEAEKAKKIAGLDNDQMAQMEKEMAHLQRDYAVIEERLGTDVLHLTIAKTYLSTLLGNANVVRYLAQHHNEIFMEFQKITEISSLAGAEAT